MLAVRSGADGIEAVEVPEPQVTGDHEVIVHVTSAGICGTDLHLLAAGPLATTPGHEVAGILDSGQAVAIEPFVPCGACRRCDAGRGHLCREVGRSFYGMARPGGMAERIVVDRRTLVPLPSTVDPSGGALVEPIAVVLHGLHRAGTLTSASVLVVGGGTIGLLAVAAARHLGATVDLAARHPAQLEAGAALGAGTVPGRDYDLVVDAAGSQTAIDLAVSSTTAGGTVLALGVPWDPVTMPAKLVTREITYLPSMVYGHHHGTREFETAADLLGQRPDLVDLVVTHRFPLHRAADAWAVAADRASGALKVHLLPQT